MKKLYKEQEETKALYKKAKKLWKIDDVIKLNKKLDRINRKIIKKLYPNRRPLAIN